MNTDRLRTYKEQMTKIHEAQFEIDKLVAEVLNFPKAFRDYKRLDKTLNEMRDYLRTLSEEYERVLPALIKDSTDIKLVDLKKLLDFTGGEKEEWNIRYLKNHNQAVSLVRQELLPIKRAE